MKRTKSTRENFGIILPHVRILTLNMLSNNTIQKNTYSIT